MSAALRTRGGTKGESAAELGGAVPIAKLRTKAVKDRVQERMVMAVACPQSGWVLKPAGCWMNFGLAPRESVFGEGEGADAVAGDGEDGVADRWENRGQGGFAEAGGRIVCFQEMDFDFAGNLIHSNGRVFVEIAL